jgi:hypothetical protein
MRRSENALEGLKRSCDERIIVKPITFAAVRTREILNDDWDNTSAKKIGVNPTIIVSNVVWRKFALIGLKIELFVNIKLLMFLKSSQ